MLEAAKAPAPEAQLLGILIRQAPAYGVHAKSDGEWAALFASYLDALEGMPPWAVEEAFVRWARGEGHANSAMAGFYPKPPQVAMLAQAAKRDLVMAAYRARKALEYVEDHVPRITPAERVERGAQLRDLLADLDRTKKPNPLEDTRPRLTPAQVAANLRASVEPKSEVGDVI